MIALPATGSSSARAVQDWTDDGTGTMIQSMLHDSAGYRTTLMRVAPGPLGAAHAHAEIEQVYVLDGDFFDEEHSYAAGDLVVRAAGAMHRTGSKAGCTMLLIYTPAAERRR